MAALYDSTVPITQWGALNAGVIPNDVFGVAINWFVNRTPVFARFPKAPVGSPTFAITNDNYRPRSSAITAVADNTNAVLTVPDSSIYTAGDVIQIESEILLITAVNTAANTAAVTRGYASTTAAAHTNTNLAYLIGNTRTGAEVDVNGLSRIPATTLQYCQTIQHPYQVGGALMADTNYVSAWDGPLSREKMLAMQHTVDDFEGSCYYGKGVVIAAAGTRPAMHGFFNLLSTNKTTSPTNSSAYKPSDLIRDTVQACFNAGGNPSILLVSTDFLSGLAIWGHAAMRVDAGTNRYGTPIDVLEVPFLGGLTLVPCPLLRSGTVICLSIPEVRIRLKRPMYDKPRGSRGDAVEGDIIMEGALEVDNEAHHAWVSGITAFAAA